MEISSLGSSALINIPFVGDKYTGDIDIKIYKDLESKSLFIKVVGERVILESFQGPYHEDLQAKFEDLEIKQRDELGDLREIFGNTEARSNYGSQKPQNDEEIEKRINFNAKRFHDGDMFSSFLAIDKTTEKIMGFVSIGGGYQAGESQSALIINPKYKGSAYGKEIVLLAASLAHVYFENKFEVGPKNDKAPVQRFSATVLDTNSQEINFLKKMGFSYDRVIKRNETYSDASRSLYVIKGEDIIYSLFKYTSLQKLNWEIISFIENASISEEGATYNKGS